jgi:hypothetical protein
MISKDDSFPKRSLQALASQDVFWTQFNEVNFYVEDEKKEHFYLKILQKLFYGVRISKIFPLGGKTRVVEQAATALDDKTRVFIVDNDFDSILNQVVDYKNLFYLKRYSIENYLIEEEAIYELTLEHDTTLSFENFQRTFNYSDFENDCVSVLQPLSCAFLTICRYSLGISYVGINPAHHCDVSSRPTRLKLELFNEFYGTIDARLKAKNVPMTMTEALDNSSQSISTGKECLERIPGHYLLVFLKYRLERTFKGYQMTLDSFMFRLAKNSKFESLEYLRKSISDYTTG